MALVAGDPFDFATVEGPVSSRSGRTACGSSSEAGRGGAARPRGRSRWRLGPDPAPSVAMSEPAKRETLPSGSASAANVPSLSQPGGIATQVPFAYGSATQSCAPLASTWALGTNRRSASRTAAMSEPSGGCSIPKPVRSWPPGTSPRRLDRLQREAPTRPHESRRDALDHGEDLRHGSDVTLRAARRFGSASGGSKATWPTRSAAERRRRRPRGSRRRRAGPPQPRCPCAAPVRRRRRRACRGRGRSPSPGSRSRRRTVRRRPRTPNRGCSRLRARSGRSAASTAPTDARPPIVAANDSRYSLAG